MVELSPHQAMIRVAEDWLNPPPLVITPKTPPLVGDIARHYDELDDLYRHAWGPHVHHGLWVNDLDCSSIDTATQRLLERVTTPLELRPTDRVVDIGSGYGASARWIAERHGAQVTALTLSKQQHIRARQEPSPSRGHIDFRWEDWLHNTLPDQSMDAAIAIESLAHMTDQPLFFQQLHRILKPGGRAALACWTSANDLTPLEQRLLETICKEGRLASLGTLTEYGQLARAAGLQVLRCNDLTHQVERTWWIIAGRVLRGLVTRPAYLRFIIHRLFRERVFLLTLPRLILAYRTGALRYGLLVLAKKDP